MRNILTYSSALLLTICLTCSISYAYYQYTTADGTVCFVESPEMVPVRYRSQITKKVDKNAQRINQPNQSDNSTSPVLSESVNNDARNGSEKGGYWLRFNYLFLIILGVVRFIIARKMERLNKTAHVLYFRRATLFLLVVVACYFNKDIVYGCTEAIRFKVASIQQSMAEQREKDKKPLKPLSEKVPELAQ